MKFNWLVAWSGMVGAYTTAIFNNHGWKGGITKLNIALYDTFASQLYPVEETRRSDQNQDYLEVKCSKCQKWFIPKQNQTSNRILGINGKTQGESRFYCSEECNEKCV